jgi:hypothetical protein
MGVLLVLLAFADQGQEPISTANPATADSKTENGSGTGSYESNLTGSAPSTTYHVRAYAKNSVGTTYGRDVAFTTKSKTNRTGHFVHSGSWTGAGHGADGWYVGDLNGDGRDDIFRYLPGVSGADVFLSDGTQFVPAGSWTGAGHGADGWYVGRFKGDYDTIFRYLPGISGADMFFRKMNTFVRVGSWTGAGHGADGWYVGDFDGDKFCDIFRYMPGISGAQVFLSSGYLEEAGKFNYYGSWTDADHGTDGWYIGDFNGDGRDDIFRYMPGVSGAQVFFSGWAKFVFAGSWTGAGHGTDGWYVGDFDGDTRDDIFRYVPGASGADVFLSDGTQFVHVGSWTGAGHGADGWYVGDFNGDGCDDIFRYLPGVSGADVFLATWTLYAPAAGTESLGTLELDEDMMLDVYGARQMVLSYDEEAAFLAPFVTRLMMGDKVSIYEIRAAYEQRVGRVVRLVEIRQLLQRHGYWDIEGQVGRVKDDREKTDLIK